MRHAPPRKSLIWAHIGDLHITGEQEPNYRDFLSVIDAIDTQLVSQIDFCVLPGDNANDGSPAQYELIRRGLDRLKVPVHVIPGDHDRKTDGLHAFYEGLRVAALPYAETLNGYRCLFLDLVSAGAGGPDFQLGDDQLRWLESQLEDGTRAGLSSIVFMHAYPSDLKPNGQAVRDLFAKHAVAFVDMGHTHYNELANDGATIFATTRSTGQLEEGPVGFSLACLHDGIVSWRFKPLHAEWPLVMITSPADYRLVTAISEPARDAEDFLVTARVLGSQAVRSCRFRIDSGLWTRLTFDVASNTWQGRCRAPVRQFKLSVEAVDAAGCSNVDTIVVAGPDTHFPRRRADGSDADALGAWPERHLLGTRLGPNCNGRQW